MGKSGSSHEKLVRAATSRHKIWFFRLLACIGFPIFSLVLLEVGLRLVNFGYPTSFLLKTWHKGKPYLVQNNQFGWRFFGPRAARQPAPICIPYEKDTNTVRVVVFGESAAFGDPEPRFGLPRMLEAIFNLRHPDKKIEVINAAMTGINSHVILPLARDWTKTKTDVWVIYMGNNEIVGPFGIGSVFGNHALPRFAIEGGLLLKQTRIGQLIEAIIGSLLKSGAETHEWEGMRAFVGYKVPSWDPRLKKVYQNFEENLSDILATAKKSGVKVILCTVAVNLKDCAPFASLQAKDLPEAQLSEWKAFFEAATKAQAAHNFTNALPLYEKAKSIDNKHAELRFRIGQCALALGDSKYAKEEFEAALDLDALRFRCDTQLNTIIRKYASKDVEFVDCVRILETASPEGVPGLEYFYDHVHLTFLGNYLIAQSIVAAIERALNLPTNKNWPTIEACADLLAFTRWAMKLIYTEMLGRLSDVPFTYQANHEDQMRYLFETARKLPSTHSTETLIEAQNKIEMALKQWPHDAILWEQLAEVKQAQGDLQGATAAAKQALDILPTHTQCWNMLGILLANQHLYTEAMPAFEKAIQLDPQAVWAMHNLAQCYTRMGQPKKALALLKRATKIKPDYGTAWLLLGQVYEQVGRSNIAQACYKKAITKGVNQPEDLVTLARFCVTRGWYDQALTNYLAAIELNPLDVSLRLETGRLLAKQGRYNDAAFQFAAAVDLTPNNPQARMQLGTVLGLMGQHNMAEKEFREALRLDPNQVEARVNLGVALYKQGKLEEARTQFEQVLQHNPNDPTAQFYLTRIRESAK